MASEDHDLVERFTAARTGSTEAVLEGFHAIKHAVRFGAELAECVVLAGTPGSSLPPELEHASIRATAVAAAVFDRIVPRRPPVPVVARAPRGAHDPHTLLDPRNGSAGRAPVILLEDPTHAGNVGATVRVAAAAGAAGVLTTGELDPWGPAALRGVAGLQYALPVGRLERVDAALTGPRRVIAFDPYGVDLRTVTPPPGAILAFGTEREGISPTLREGADEVVRIPMRPQVSSLNLATSVAVALYGFTEPMLDH